VQDQLPNPGPVDDVHLTRFKCGFTSCGHLLFRESFNFFYSSTPHFLFDKSFFWNDGLGL